MVVILGILAATIIPQFIGTTNSAKIGTAKSNIAELETQIERFNLNMDRYPTTQEGLDVLVNPPADDEDKKWRGPYIKLLRDDPWGNPFQYRSPGTQGAGAFYLWSMGADGVDGGEEEGARRGEGRVASGAAARYGSIWSCGSCCCGGGSSQAATNAADAI